MVIANLAPSPVEFVFEFYSSLEEKRGGAPAPPPDFLLYIGAGSPSIALLSSIDEYLWAEADTLGGGVWGARNPSWGSLGLRGPAAPAHFSILGSR